MFSSILNVIVNENTDSHKKIKLSLVAANKCYFGQIPLLKTKCISWRAKITLYEVLVRPIGLYACGTWATTKPDKNKLATFERKIFRRTFEPKRNIQGKCGISTN